MISSNTQIRSAHQQYYEQPKVVEITEIAFKHDLMMAKCDPGHGKYFACFLMYRGDIPPKDIGASICCIKTKKYSVCRLVLHRI